MVDDVMQFFTPSEICTGTFDDLFRLVTECEGWLFAVDRGLLTWDKAEARASARARRVLRRIRPVQEVAA